MCYSGQLKGSGNKEPGTCCPAQLPRLTLVQQAQVVTNTEFKCSTACNTHMPQQQVLLCHAGHLQPVGISKAGHDPAEAPRILLTATLSTQLLLQAATSSSDPRAAGH
jgi:hypothetical protein